MPGTTFIPGPGDSAVENDPTTRAGNLLDILHKNQFAKQQLQLGSVQLQDAQMRVQQAQLENQRLSLINSMLPQEQQIGIQERQQAILNSQQQQKMMQEETMGAAQKNYEFQQEHLPTSPEEQMKQAELHGMTLQQDKAKFDLDQAKGASQEWADSVMPMVYSDANGYTSAFRSHMKNPLTSQMLQNFQQKQAETDYYKSHANEIQAQAAWMGTRADAYSERTQAMLQAHTMQYKTQMYLGQLKAQNPGVSYDQILLKAQMSPDQDIAMDATMELMKAHNDKPAEVPGSVSPSGDIIPAHQDTEGFITKAGKLLKAMTATRTPQTSSKKGSGTKDDPIQGVSPAESLSLTPGTYFIGTDGKLRVR